MSRKIMQQALEFCQYAWRDIQMDEYSFEQLEKTIAALEAELSKPEQEPVGFVIDDEIWFANEIDGEELEGTPLYALGDEK